MRDVSKVALETADGELTPQAVHLLRLYCKALEEKNIMKRKMIKAIVTEQYKQPSFLEHFDECDNDPREVPGLHDPSERASGDPPYHVGDRPELRFDGKYALPPSAGARE